MGWFVFLVLIVGIVIDYFIAKEFEHIAVEKGYSEKKYFWWTFWLFAVGMLMVIALPDHRAQKVIGVNQAELNDTPSAYDDLPEL